VYEADDSFATQLLAYVVAGLDAGQPVTVRVGPRKQAILADVLGPDAALVSFADPATVYTRPEAALAFADTAIGNLASDSDPGVRIYGELPIVHTQEEWNAWCGYEAIINRAFEDRRATITCGYDARVVPEPVLRQARQTHRVILDDAWQLSPDYEDPETLVRSLTPPVESIDGLRSLPLGDPQELQDRLADELEAAAVPESSARDMLVALREVLANAERYGNGVRAFRLGRVGEQVVCEVTDSGPGIDDPLVGYLPPRPLGRDAAGLWIARQLTSRLELKTDADGLTVRLWS
jgi:anti-sigma regulatory factor (Ser/Thr protein kinase)